MSKTFRDIKFPPTYKYSSDSDYIPLEFYEEAFPISKNIDLLLGYFSSNAFKVLSHSMAEFIFNGGNLRIITNHVYTLKDKENLLDDIFLDDENEVIDIFGDIEKLEKTLSGYGKHFFDCLKYLLNHNRLQIVPVKFNDIDLSHSKKMILYDGSNYISTDGSINFTLSALTKNSESFEVNAPWEGDIFKKRTIQERDNFNKIISKEHADYIYLESKDIEVVINKIGNTKDEIDLLEDSIKIDGNAYGKKIELIIKKKKFKFEYIIGEATKTPRFPYIEGPRGYQIEAFDEWESNNCSGIFAMATGTGKTITSLNCVLNEYRKTKKYKAIILVPSIALLNQWEEETLSFNFNKILKVGGGNNWESELGAYVSNLSWGIDDDIIIISTYGSFVTTRFQKYFKKIEKDLMLIADEAHNMGASNIKKVISGVNVNKKIGLSATPKRVYDIEGTDAIDEFFNDKEPYTYSFSMERALSERFLTEYKYYPILVELNEDEFEDYIEISKKLLKFFDFEKGEYKKEKIVETLLLKRKNIIHKADNKISAFKIILKELKKKDLLKYIFTYIPEGYVDGQEDRILNKFIRAGIDTIPELKLNTYTAEDEDLKGILRGFSEGKINLLFAMKMLDEGVDVPRAEVGIFCSSTGNPRQFIQRRGRLLRKHKEKVYATIYDMVVIPNLKNQNQELVNFETNLVKGELRRVAYFASLSMNYYETRDELLNVCNKYDLNLDNIISEL